jgi:hypothetical protein
MKYIQHKIRARDDRKIIELIEKHGPTGYGIYWIVMEELDQSPAYRIALTDSWLKRIAKINNISDHMTLFRVLETMAELNLLHQPLWEEKIITPM